MKKVSLMYTLLILVGLQLVACGPTKQDPLEDYEDLQLSENPQPQEKIVYKYVDKEVPAGEATNNYVPVPTQVGVDNEKIVYIKAQLPQSVPELTLNEYPILVSTSNDKLSRSDSILYFFESSVSISCINVKINFESLVNFDFDIVGLPDGVVKIDTTDDEKQELASTNRVKHCLQYAAPTGLIASDMTSIDGGKVTITVKDLKYVDPRQEYNTAVEGIFKQISLTREVPLILYKYTPEIIQLLNARADVATAPTTENIQTSPVPTDTTQSEASSLAPTKSIRPRSRPTQDTQNASALAPVKSIRPRSRPTQDTQNASALAPVKSIRPQARPVKGN